MVFLYAIPPALGAVIGYVTNAIAIRMLFRPLTEKRIFGIRVPLTPGIIPKQREQLAHSIGRMVSTRLLTEDSLRKHVVSESFREGLTGRISVWTSQLVAVSESDLVTDGQGADPVVADTTETKPAQQERTPDPESMDDPVIDLPASDALVDFVATVLQRFLESEKLDAVVSEFSRSSMNALGSVHVEEVLQDPESAADMVGELLTVIVEGPVAQRITEFSDAWLSGQIDENVPMRRYLTDDFIVAVEKMVDAAYEPIFAHAMEWLRRPDVRQELSHRGRIILRDVLDRLNVFQRFFVSAAQYERNLNERMPEIISDLLQTIDGAGRLPANRERVVMAVGDAMRKIQELGVRDALTTLDFDLRAFAGRTIPELFHLIRHQEVHDGIIRSMLGLYGEYRQKTLAEILQVFTGLKEAEVTERAVVIIRSWVATPGNTARLSKRLVGMVERFIRDARMASRGPIVEVPVTQKHMLDRFIAEKVTDLLGSRAGEVIEAVDIYQMVVDKINELEIENVESLLLMVIAKHLKWINLFGALLGSLIGGAQVIINLFL